MLGLECLLQYMNMIRLFVLHFFSSRSLHTGSTCPPVGAWPDCTRARPRSPPCEVHERTSCRTRHAYACATIVTGTFTSDECGSTERVQALLVLVVLVPTSFSRPLDVILDKLGPRIFIMEWPLQNLGPRTLEVCRRKARVRAHHPFVVWMARAQLRLPLDLCISQRVRRVRR